MIEKIDGIAEIGRQASSGNISPRRLELYLALERCVPGGLTLLRNDAGYFVLCRMGRGYAGNAATVVEHFFVYRDGGGASWLTEQEGTGAAICAAIDVFPTGMLLTRDCERYAFLLSTEIDGSLYVPLVGGTDPFMIKRAYHALIRSAFAQDGRIREVDAASDYPFLKRQMGFAPQSFHAVLQGDPEWRHYVM